MERKKYKGNYEDVENGKVKFITTPNGLARRLLASVVVADLVERVSAGRGKSWCLLIG